MAENTSNNPEDREKALQEALRARQEQTEHEEPPWEAMLRDLAKKLGNEIFQLLIALDTPDLRVLYDAAQKTYPDSFVDQNFHLLYEGWWNSESMANMNSKQKHDRLMEELVKPTVGRKDLQIEGQRIYDEYSKKASPSHAEDVVDARSPEKQTQSPSQAPPKPSSRYEILTNKNLGGLAARIGHEHGSLATFLGIGYPRLQQLQRDHKFSTVTMVTHLLLDWRDARVLQDREQERNFAGTLSTALHKAGRFDLANMVNSWIAKAATPMSTQEQSGEEVGGSLDSEVKAEGPIVESPDQSMAQASTVPNPKPPVTEVGAFLHTPEQSTTQAGHPTPSGYVASPGYWRTPEEPTSQAWTGDPPTHSPAAAMHKTSSQQAVGQPDASASNLEDCEVTDLTEQIEGLHARDEPDGRPQFLYAPDNDVNLRDPRQRTEQSKSQDARQRTEQSKSPHKQKKKPEAVVSPMPQPVVQESSDPGRDDRCSPEES